MTGMVIVGAGECGVRAAFTLRELGYLGPVTLLSAEDSLPYERPPLSKGTGSTSKAIRAEELYAQAGINLKRGVEAHAISRQQHQVHLSDGSVLPYDRLLIATGSKARQLECLEGCLTLRSDEDARRIASTFQKGARIAMIGGGFIGLELAATARQCGADVTVIEAAPRILGRAVPEAISEIVHARHISAGVKILTGNGVAMADGTRIALTTGAELTFDAVIAGTGSVPETALAAQAGLSVENGILVDGRFNTSDPDIFAAGDCCNFEWDGKRVRLESWKAAQDQGAHAAASMLGSSANYDKVPWFWSDQYDLTLQVSGLFDQARDTHHRPSTGDATIVFQCDGDGRLAAAAGIGPGNAAAKEIRIFEKLIERKASVQLAELADPNFNIKALLKADRITS